MSVSASMHAGTGKPRLVDVADRLQDFVVDNLRIGLPLVPATSRPARAGLVDGAATWLDRETGWRCAIGDYRRAPRAI
ncbi:hypothetical protein VSH64_05995 [Amycolatopsis rhabdoformis]|uniref:Uncharacterized protein n=1 Tax=Amycolatopsis rhabdoformis TaxID=1448059 RepID=A0ABZ1IDZ8_9PSEU|nr:hypothetical protein [Amycolatopsis rhabdoformis]WSE31660.1 hypothetical protein VSH64_05995 [Amycolatopsis rhabdoformis]